MSSMETGLQDLCDKDGHLVVQDTKLGLAQPVFGPVDLNNLQTGHFLFIKDQKFLNEVLLRRKNFSGLQVGAIIDSLLFEKISVDSDLLSLFSWIFTTSCMDISISILSKHFYQLKYSSLMNMVDGRQMGTAEVHPTANIAQSVSIGPHVVIGEDVTIHSGSVIMANAIIAAGCEIYPNVTIYPFVKIGKNCRIHGGVVIGADGFGYNFQAGVHHKVWHMGSVIIEDHVEIGANSCVDGGTFSPTFIGAGTKLDNHVQIGHNCQLGKAVVICGHVAIGGSSTLGDYTVFGGKSGMGHGHHLGAGCQVAGGALVNANWPDGSVLGGHPARNLKEWMKGVAYVRKESLRPREKKI